MTDINQWRRMIQPTRARTPALEPEDASLLSPTTPRKLLKPKLSSYFNQHAAPPGRSKTDVVSDEELFNQNAWYPVWTPNESGARPDAERLIESVMCKLLAEPNRALDPRFSTLLMQIFESYRHLKDDSDCLRIDLQQEIEKREALEQALHHASQQWEAEKHDYKAEVKRLELILAKGKRGLAEVTLARQDSILRHGKKQSMGNDDSMETIFEFLEKTKRYEDRAWSSQRATMRRRSPSAQMRRLSRNLTKKSSTTNVHADLPFGRPHLAERSFLGEPDSNRRADTAMRPESQAKSHVSDDTLSTFSCAGDFLPDETADVNLIQAAGTDNDLVAIKRIANVVAKRRHVDPSAVMPNLLAMFEAQSEEKENSKSLTTGLGIQVPLIDRYQPAANLRKHPTLKGKASGFLSKFRPQLNVDTSIGLARRFSFEAGDDANASLSAPALDTLPPTVRDRLLRKSASMSSLEIASNKATTQERLLSPVAQSPTTSAPPQEFVGTPPDQDEAKRTRIPTPVFNMGSLARPRRDRDDSASSLLTAIKVSRPVSQRSGSASSSSYSSPSASRSDLTQGLATVDAIQGSGQRNNRLLHHTNSLRGGMAAVAAQRAANINLNNVDLQHAATHGQRKESTGNNSRSSTLSRTDVDLGEPRKENQEPMRRSISSNTQGNARR